MMRIHRLVALDAPGSPSSSSADIDRRWATTVEIDRSGISNFKRWYLPVVGSPRTGLLADWYISGGITRNWRPRRNYLWLASTEEPQYCSHPNSMPEGDTFDLFFTENETKISLQPDPLDCISISDKEQYGYDLSSEDMTYKESEKNYASKTNSLVNGRFLSFPIDSELHKALGITSVEEYDSSFLNTTVPMDVGPVNSITTVRGVISEYHDHTFDESNSWLIKESGTEYLFDAMVSSLLCGADDDTFDGRSLRSFSDNLSERLVDSSPRENKSESSLLDISSLLPTSQQRSTSVSKADGFMSSISSSKSFCKSTNEDNYNHMAEGHYGRRLAVINKRGVRNGNSHKPRPRDRQLIQERVKELRELIPNGSKVCNFDLYRSVWAVHIGPSGYRYTGRPLPGGSVKNRPSAVDFDHRRPILKEIDRRRSIEEEKGKKKRKRKKKRREEERIPRQRRPRPPAVATRGSPVVATATAFSPARGDRSRRHRPPFL
ncbi:hypothetical protein BHM03_00054776, partial [Ensete ventricosum]